MTEAVRVEDAASALESANRPAFGDLMTASHRSLRDDFQVSVPELDELVELSLEAGADGARLTGAGFGGSMVALCSDVTADGVRSALREGYYAPRGRLDSLDQALFFAEAGPGARVVRA